MLTQEQRQRPCWASVGTPLWPGLATLAWEPAKGRVGPRQLPLGAGAALLTLESRQRPVWEPRFSR